MRKYVKFNRELNKLFNDTGMLLEDLTIFDKILQDLENRHYLNITDNVYDFVQKQVLDMSHLSKEEKYELAIKRALNKFPNG